MSLGSTTLLPTQPEVALQQKYIWRPLKPKVKVVLVCTTAVNEIPTATLEVKQFNGVVFDLGNFHVKIATLITAPANAHFGACLAILMLFSQVSVRN